MRLPAIEIVYEDPQAWRNCTSCGEWATPGSRLVYDAWVHGALMHYSSLANAIGLAERPRRYIYPVGLFHNPTQWAGPPIMMRNYIGPEQGPFMHVDEGVMEDARDGRVLFILDQSQEGNTDPMLWRWFYMHCEGYGIPPENVIYMTSDHLAERRHAEFCDRTLQRRRIEVISSLFNLHTLSDMMRHTVGVTTWEQPTDRPYLYNCLNRMSHQHRRWLWLELLSAGLLPQGLISMDLFTEADPLPGRGAFDPDMLRMAAELLPMVIDNPDFSVNRYNDVNREIYDSSWFTVITETYVDDNQMFIGEKVFKPMMCFSPFLVLSSSGTLSRLRELGFRTFPMLWDEGYDEMPIDRRISSIVDQIRKADAVIDKAAWMAEAEEALRHNHAMAWAGWSESVDQQRILAIWEKFAIKSG